MDSKFPERNKKLFKIRKNRHPRERPCKHLHFPAHEFLVKPISNVKTLYTSSRTHNRIHQTHFRRNNKNQLSFNFNSFLKTVYIQTMKLVISSYFGVVENLRFYSGDSLSIELFFYFCKADYFFNIFLLV